MLLVSRGAVACRVALVARVLAVVLVTSQALRRRSHGDSSSQTQACGFCREHVDQGGAWTDGCARDGICRARTCLNAGGKVACVPWEKGDRLGEHAGGITDYDERKMIPYGGENESSFGPDAGEASCDCCFRSPITQNCQPPVQARLRAFWESPSDAQCETFPFTNAMGLPEGLTMLDLRDTELKNCGEATKHIEAGFRVGLGREFGSVVEYNYTSTDEEAISCPKLPPATLHIRMKASPNLKLQESISKCADEKSDAPRVVLGGAPLDSIRYTLSSKGLFAKMVQDYEAAHLDVPTLHPETFRITSSSLDCHDFFGKVANGTLPKESNDWILKPVRGQGGEGIVVVKDFDKQLKETFGSCSWPSDQDNWVVQRYLNPFLIKGRKFHIRLFLLYKFRSGEAGNEHATPPQAWNIRIGEMLFCAEPYTSNDDPVLSEWASKCNLHKAMSHPKYGQPGYRRDDLVKTYPWGMVEGVSSKSFRKLVKRLDTAMRTLAGSITRQAKEMQVHGNANEANWMVLGCDFQVDKNLKPFLLEVNTCPGAPEGVPGDENVDPYPAVMQIMLTNYRRELLHDPRYDEKACGSPKSTPAARAVRVA